MDGRNKQLCDSQPSIFDYDDFMIRKQFPSINFTPPSDVGGAMKLKSQLWDPKTMLNNLSIMEEKIHQLQELVRLIVGKSSSLEDQSNQVFIQQQQQLVTADLTSIIIQLISTAGSLLPSSQNPNPNPNPNSIPNPSVAYGADCNNNINNNQNGNANVVINKVEDQSANETDHMMDIHEEHDDDVDEGENLPPGSYEILQLEKEEILAPHTHFCVICGKGFKRDANLRMHMRGHGDEYKTPAALAKPTHKEDGGRLLIKRYSCPFLGCKRNKDHKKFQPLKTILCVKNHYKRSHCDKSYTCSRCNTKKFSVIADLKTHEKHCGRDRWLCSCGTTFSRKDKLFGHISLFQGHTPAIPLDEPKQEETANANANAHTNANANALQEEGGVKEAGFFDFNFNASNDGVGGGSGVVGEVGACFSPFPEFPRILFEDSDSLSFLLSSSSSSGPLWKNGLGGGESSSRDL